VECEERVVGQSSPNAAMWKDVAKPAQPPADTDDSDFGRRYGWLIEKDGQTLGELDYVRWDWESQFWHEYRVSWRKPEDAATTPDAWLEMRLTLRNRRFKDVVIDTFMVGTERGEGIVPIRGACVSEARIQAG